MTQPTAPALDTDEQLSGRAVDAVADMHGELRRRYTGLNTAEAQLAEALLTAHATSETGRRRLQEIQRQLVEAIDNPVNALDTPAGERQFLIFLRGKIAEIRQVVDDGVLTAHDQADVTQALANGYLGDDPSPAPQVTAAAPSPATQPAGAAPAAGMASMPPGLGGLPMGGSPPTPPGAGGLGAAATPLSDLASLLAGERRTPDAQADDETAPLPEHDAKDDEHDPDDDDDDDDDAPPADPDDTPPDQNGPNETRPADR